MKFRLKNVTLLLVISMCGAVHAGPVMTIVPTSWTTTVPANGSGSMTWTVTNTAPKAFTNMTFPLPIRTSGQSIGYTDNACTGNSVIPGGRCTFKTAYSGANQPSSFTISPVVCAYNGLVCTVSSPLTVMVNAHVSYAYITTGEVNSVAGTSTLTPINTTTLQAGTPLSGLSVSGFNRVAVSSDGTKVYFADSGLTGQTTLRIVSAGTEPALLGSLALTAASGVGFVVVTPNNQVAYIHTVFSDQLYIANVSSVSNPTLTTTLTLSVSPRGMVMNPAGTAVYIVETNDHIEQINTSNNAKSTLSTALTGLPYGITINPSGTKLYVTDSTSPGVVEVIDSSDGSRISTITVGADPEGITASPDGTKVYVANAGEETVSVINTSTNLLIDTLSVGCFPRGVSVSPDSSRVFVTCSGSNEVPVINVSAGTVSDIALPNSETATTEVGNFVG